MNYRCCNIIIIDLLPKLRDLHGKQIYNNSPRCPREQNIYNIQTIDNKYRIQLLYRYLTNPYVGKRDLAMILSNSNKYEEQRLRHNSNTQSNLQIEVMILLIISLIKTTFPLYGYNKRIKGYYFPIWREDLNYERYVRFKVKACVVHI